MKANRNPRFFLALIFILSLFSCDTGSSSSQGSTQVDSQPSSSSSSSSSGSTSVNADTGTNIPATVPSSSPSGSTSGNADTGTTPPATLPAASFTYAASGRDVQFTDMSSGSPATWSWDFGDGAVSTLQSPGHTYAAEGTYTVTLSAVSSLGAGVVTKSVTVGQTTFRLSSEAGVEAGSMSSEYTCDGAGASPALSWSGVPAGTTEFALMMTTIPVDGSTKWNWVLYRIPYSVTSLSKNTSGVGILGTGSHGTTMAYDPPCSQGPGAKTYTFTLYALSGSPSLPASANQVTGEVLANAISGITIGTAVLNLSYARAGTTDPQNPQNPQNPPNDQNPGDPSGFTTTQSVSDVAQQTTLAFAGLGMMTGNLEAQSFFPPGKVADYTGFQYLRDNDPDGMGHNTSFLTRVSSNMLYMLNDTQLAKLKTVATGQISQIEEYGYKRFALMKAFRRLMDGNIPAGSTGLDLEAVKTASKELYALDGQISYDRAVLYSDIFRSFDSTQKAYIDNMKGKGWNSWADIDDSVVREKLRGLSQQECVAVMTYAGDLFSWYAGSIDADVYFCPERHGTYFGSFYIKDAPAIGHEGYTINEQLTATAGSALCDSSKGYVTSTQAARISSLVDTQRNNLYAGNRNIVQVRTDIATSLRRLISDIAPTDAQKAEILSIVRDNSEIYGELDGENNYNYATVFAEVYKTLTSEQKTKLSDLRKSIMSGTYSDGTAFDFSVCTTPYLFSSPITNTSVLAPYIANTDYLF